MLSSALVTAALAAQTATEEESSLPAEPWVFGVSALILFGALLAITWAFRSVGNKH